jgi:microcystin-dependent protein
VTYSALFDAIGYTYGGSGTSFVIPDCRGRATYGQEQMIQPPHGGGLAIRAFAKTCSANHGIFELVLSLIMY